MDFLQPFYKRDFIKQTYRVHDTSSNSPYVEFVDMPTYIGGGVSLVKFYPSTINLHTSAQLEVEVLDALGNAVRTEIPEFRDRFGNYYVSIYVQDSTAEGYGSISFVGVANATPDGEYIEPDDVNSQGFNLIIAKPLLIQPFERNESPLVFDRPPQVSIGQIVAPAKTVTTDSKGTGNPIKYLTGSIITANVEGFDKVSATSKDIQDSNIRDFALKNQGVSSTANQVMNTVRQDDYDIQGGQLLTDTNRFRTIYQITNGFDARSNDKGALVILSTGNTYTKASRSLSSTAVYAKTNPYNNLVLPGQTQSLATQLSQYAGTVIRVLNKSSYLLDKPLQVNVDSFNSSKKNSLKRTATHTFRSSQDIKTEVEYIDPVIVVTSTTVSQSYLQFTFQDLKPIGGNVYRIKSFYRQNSLSGDYQIINDQRVASTEYLTDAKDVNSTSYAKEVSPFKLYGHFLDQLTLETFWKGYRETATSIDTYYATRNEDVLMDSAYLPVPAGSITTILTTQGYQIYQKSQAFSFSFVCVLEANTILEVYANSAPASTQLYDSTPFAQAYNLSKNSERARYPQTDSRFGKFIGNIANNSGERKDYGRVIFDLLADNDGYGRPLFRIKSIDTTKTAAAYLSEISVTPLKRNGYTPEIYQYAINAPPGFESLVSESVDFKFEYYDHTGKQSEYVTYLNGINLSLTSEIESNVCRVENYKFFFNPTIWAIVTESATYRNTAIAPYMFSSTSPPINAYGSAYANITASSNTNTSYNTHSFCQLGSNDNTVVPSFAPTNALSYMVGGWGKSASLDLRASLTSSTIRSRRYYPAYDQMYAQLSFNNAYGRVLQYNDLGGYYNSAKRYGYGIGSTYNGPDPTLHEWTGWNALRPYKPIFAPRWLNRTTLADLGAGVFDGKFIYTSSWEIYPGLGQAVRTTEGDPIYSEVANAAGGVAPTGSNVKGGPGSVRPAVSKATVQASWKFFDQFSETYSQLNGSAMYIDFIPTNAQFTASFNRAVISASYKPASISNPFGSSSLDLQPPVNSGAAGITRFDVSQSYITTSGAGFTTAQKATAYKQRRFYFPFSGPLTGSVFTENGGIYNVKFRLKRYQSGSNSSNWFSPDTGSYLMLYIFDVSTPFDGLPTQGQPGYYPPSQNIVKIGNQITTNGYNIPPIQFYDSVTGYLYDEYEINLIQYGTPGQLVFEPSGDPGSYFGCAVDSVEFCKIGVTTDPYYIKPPKTS